MFSNENNNIDEYSSSTSSSEEKKEDILNENDEGKINIEKDKMQSFEENLTRTHNYIWYVHLIFLSFGIFSILKSNVYQLSGLTYLIKKNNLIRIAILAIAALIFLWIVR